MARWLVPNQNKRLLLGKSWYSLQSIARSTSSWVNVNHCQFLSASDPHRSSSSSSPSPSSTSTTTTTATLTADELLHSKILNSPPRVLFPWRHDLEPLPYVVHNPLGGTLAKPTWKDWIFVHLITNMVAVTGLGVPWYKVFGSQWRNDFADSAAFAFSQSVNAVLTSAFRLPWNETTATPEDLLVTFDSNNSKSEESNDSSDKGKNHDSHDDDENYPSVEDMLEERLVRQYQAAHEYGRDHIRIRLQMRPTAAHVHNVFAIPFLTRDEVRKEPSLQEKFPNFLMGVDGLASHQIARAANQWMEHMMVEQFERRGEPIASWTIIAQVLVHCDELFSVHDVQTGMLLQGDADGAFHPVLHLVRLEMVTEYNLETGEFQKGQWIITDWDDLLEGNIWFL